VSRCCWRLDIFESLIDRLQRHRLLEGGGCLFVLQACGGYGSFGSSHWAHAVRVESEGILQVEGL